ncbi:MAG: RluA family pseudouridine synthase [Chloroflexota bacterium]|nr:RluA family pseudouridine synthase [Chloroflexota bacterium]
MKTQRSNIDNPECIYQDDDLLIINKPPGLLSIPDGYDSSLPHLKSVLKPIYGNLWIVHRLDKETSGIMLLARNKDAHRKLNESFRERRIKKTYHGLVTPLPNWREMHIKQPLKPNADRKHRTRVDQVNGKIAETVCKVIKRAAYGALMEINILTGITHQIRAHLRTLDLILFGESLYNAGLPSLPFPVQRLMLHARFIGFKHPSHGEWIRFEAPYPNDFRVVYTKLLITTIRDVMT